MLQIQEHIDLRSKTTLRIGGKARYYVELRSKEDCAEAVQFADGKNVPLIVLGGGSNTIFADGTIEALIVRIKAEEMKYHPERCRGLTRVEVNAGKNLANLINELAEENLDLSPLTGIPGTVGGAIYGNSGQGFGGIWTNTYVESVDVLVDSEWKSFTNEQCRFSYRSSAWKQKYQARRSDGQSSSRRRSTIIWSCTLGVPSRPKEEIKAEIDHLLKKRIETQPHVKTAGSCFLILSKETPAWKLIDAAGLRGQKIGGIMVSEKHANFLINERNATFEDAKKMVRKIQTSVKAPLQVEMRFVNENGESEF
jgi:UDP-N-acetylenolpyruvoylglucosamine reductase